MARIMVLGGLDQSLVNFRRNLLQDMVAGGHQVFACAPHASSEVRAKLSNMGVNYQDIRLERTGLNPVNDLRTIIDLARLFRKIRPDVFLGYTVKPVIYGSLAARIAGVPRNYSMIEGLGYAFMGTTLKNRILSRLVRNLYKVSLKFNKKTFFLNPDDLNLFVDDGLIADHNQAVLLNGIGVDLSEFTPASYPKEISFLLIGRLIKDKGVLEYAQAAQIIKKAYPATDFKLVGLYDSNPSGVSREELDSWVALGNINYLGFLPDVHQAIADCSVYVLPSYREGLPRTVMEAMAMARPIITTNAPGCRETVTPGVNGFLVPVRDVSALVEALRHFLEHPDDVERMGRESRRIAEEKYDVNEVNKVILETMKLA